MKNQKGFSAVLVLLSLILVVAIGFTGYFVWNIQQNKETENSVSGNEVTDNSKTNELKEICLTQEPLCLKYPLEYSAKLSTQEPGTNSPYKNDKLVITSKNGSEFTLQTGIDGIGGACDDSGYKDSDRIRVISSERSTIEDNLYVAKIDYSAIEDTPLNKEKIWLIPQSQLTPSIQPGDYLHCSASASYYNNLNGLKHTIGIEANNLDGKDDVELFNIFQSIKIGGN